MELKAITEAEKEAMLDLLTSPLINQTYMLPDFETREDALPLFHRLCDLSRDPGRFVRGIYAENTLVGFLNDVEICDGTMELGYVIHPNHWGKGYATAALSLAMEQLFARGFREIITGAFSENTASLRVMEKAGMRKLEKTDIIDYRGNARLCLYYHKEAPVF